MVVYSNARNDRAGYEDESDYDHAPSMLGIVVIVCISSLFWFFVGVAVGIWWAT